MSWLIRLRDDHPEGRTLSARFAEMPPNEAGYIRARLGELLQLLSFTVNWDLLRSLITRWDSEAMSFCTGWTSLAPTYEEYLQLSGLPHRPSLLIPSPSYTPERDLKRLFRHPALRPATIPQNGHVIGSNEVFAMMRFRPRDDRDFDTANAFILAFVGYILFPHEEGYFHPRAAELAVAVVEQRSFIPNLLGETILGLSLAVDQHARGQPARISFAPLLLQAWFCMHAGIMAFDLDDRLPLLRQLEDDGPFPVNNERGAENYFHDTKPADLYQQSPGLAETTVIVGIPGHLYVPIMGLTGAAYYTPARVLYQFGGENNFELTPFPRYIKESSCRFKVWGEQALWAWNNLVTEEASPLFRQPQQIKRETVYFRAKRRVLYDAL